MVHEIFLVYSENARDSRTNCVPLTFSTPAAQLWLNSGLLVGWRIWLLMCTLSTSVHILTMDLGLG